MPLQVPHRFNEYIMFLINMLYGELVGMRLICNNFLTSVFLSCKVERHFPSSSLLSEVRRNFPSTIGKLINKAGVKKLLLLVVFTPWRETPTQSIALPLSVLFTYREEVRCVFLNCPHNSPPTLTSERWHMTHIHTHPPTHTHTHTHIFLLCPIQPHR